MGVARRALSLLELSVVQAVISGGLVFLALLAERWFGFRLGLRQWLGLGATAAGLTVLGVTSGAPGAAGRSSLPALIAVEAGVFAVSAVLVAASIRLDRLQAEREHAAGDLHRAHADRVVEDEDAMVIAGAAVIPAPRSQHPSQDPIAPQRPLSA